MKDPSTEDDSTGRLESQLNWCVSYPKSGNTWIRLVARAYAGDTPEMTLGKGGDLNEQVYHDVSPIPLHHLTIPSEMQLRPAAMLAMANGFQSVTTFLKSHHGHYTVQSVPLWLEKWTGKVVNPVRDPRDVCCSVRHHFDHDSYEQAADMMGTEDMHIGGGERSHLHHVIGSWSQHVESWLEAPHEVLTVRYEDLKAADVQAFREILSFLLEEEPGEEVLKRSVKACRFEKMKKREQEHGFPEAPRDEDEFFRKGEAGGWKDELPTEVAHRIVEEHGAVMERLGYL